MQSPPIPDPAHGPRARAGAWLFRLRGVTPLPFLAASVALSRPTAASLATGAALVAAGEWLRFRAVAFIGPRSRTRGPTPGALVEEGPYATCRNPLYVANVVIVAGFGAASGRPVLALVLAVSAAVQYALIVSWEEGTLARAHGAAWDAYRSAVPRWGLPVGRAATASAPRPLREVLASERSTILAQAVVLGAIAARA